MKSENIKALKKAAAQLKEISETFKRISADEKYYDLQYRAVQIDEMLSCDADECGLEPMIRHIEKEDTAEVYCCPRCNRNGDLPGGTTWDRRADKCRDDILVCRQCGWYGSEDLIAKVSAPC